MLSAGTSFYWTEHRAGGWGLLAVSGGEFIPKLRCSLKKKMLHQGDIYFPVTWHRRSQQSRALSDRVRGANKANQPVTGKCCPNAFDVAEVPGKSSQENASGCDPGLRRAGRRRPSLLVKDPSSRSTGPLPVPGTGQRQVTFKVTGSDQTPPGPSPTARNQKPTFYTREIDPEAVSQQNSSQRPRSRPTEVCWAGAGRQIGGQLSPQLAFVHKALSARATLTCWHTV